MRVAYPALLRRLPGLRLAVDDDAVRFASHLAIHGLVELPVTW
jgi:cytochrome P450